MTRHTDVLVVGSGIAGLFLALRAARYGRVTILTKTDRAESSTHYAQGGIAAVFSPADTPELHEQDTLVAGVGLCHRDAVSVLVREGPLRVRELIEVGVRFTRDGDALSLGREGGHSRRRIVRADDLTGREVARALLIACAEHPRIELLENHLVVDLLVAPDPSTHAQRCCGALVLDPDSATPRPILARGVVLASGGSGQVYRHTTNPAVATGDGVAMAYRAGAIVANMEFVQFHPTALYPASGRAFLISEAVRGEGAVLRRRDGSEFMDRYHPLGSLAPRDVVARAIDREMKQSGDPHVLLDCSAIPTEELRARFPNILRETAARGLDILLEPLPVVPAAHYLCGGVFTDTHGRTSLPGLYAVGETACSGVHGANRLASNSLLEALVFAHRAGEALGQQLEDLGLLEPRVVPRRSDGSTPDRALLTRDRDEIRSLMWESVGIVRTDERLTLAAEQLARMADRYEEIWMRCAPLPELVELRNLVQTALLIVRSARQRHESRGLHFNLDHPHRDSEHFLRDTLLGR